MTRRSFFKNAGGALAAGAATVATSNAFAQNLPTIKWRLASSFPKSLDTIYGAAEVMAKHVAASTGGRFQIQIFAAGEIVPGLGVMDAVKEGTVEIGHTCSYYYFGKDPTFAFDTAVPFGLTARQTNAWMYEGGGLELMREFFAAHNIVNFPCGNTGCQMGGWYRKEIKGPEDLKGLKFRVGGFAGTVLSKLGVVPQQIAGGDIYPALEKGTIDAAEWVGPYDDEKLGFYKVAPYYYYPGWWEGSAQLTLYVNSKKFAELPQEYQQALENACAYAHLKTQAKYDVNNVNALRRLVASGTKLRPFPKSVLEACYKAAFEVYESTAASNPKFKKVYEAWRKFREDQFTWFRVAERSYEDFVYSQKTSGKK